ncbi:MAG TPA: LuxR C-terminal-related transcriptional regulator [Bryobacteraceae bacterium]|nr:LuxR C-terminal-related transcriptional regulator [Bryobacteraceae bacterium]
MDSVVQPRRRGLSEREREVVALLVQGKSQKEVAAILGISVKTVETHRTHIFSKLRIHNLEELCRYVERMGTLT